MLFSLSSDKSSSRCSFDSTMNARFALNQIPVRQQETMFLKLLSHENTWLGEPAAALKTTSTFQIVSTIFGSYPVFINLIYRSPKQYQSECKVGVIEL